MKKKIYLFVTAAMLTGMSLTSCSDFLTPENKSAGGQTADDRFGSDATQFLTATYNSLKSVAYNPELFSQGTDLYINTRGHSGGVYNEYTLTVEDDGVKSLYSNLYKTIKYANGVISYAGAESALGYEARFLRDYCYFVLTQQFGGVPYITTYINDAKRDYPRTELKDVYAGLIEDLTALYNNSSLDDQNHKGRANKQAVAALLAKVYLAAGWDLDTTVGDIEKGTYTVGSTANFTEAAAWAEKAIKGIGLTMTFADKWAPANEGNAEEIFSVQYERNGYPGNSSEGGHSMQNNFGGYYGDCTTSGQKNVGSDNAQSEKSMYLFEKGDLRYEATFMTTMYNGGKSGNTANWGTEGYYAYYNVDAAKLADFHIAHRYFPWYVTEAEVEAELAAHQSQYVQGTDITEVTAAILTLPRITKYTFNADGSVKAKSTQAISDYNNQTSNGVCVKKFDDPASEQVTSKNSYRDIVLLHVSDMYLVAAEAYMMAGKTTEALAKLNAVRNRAGLASLNAFNEYVNSYATTGSFQIRDIDVILDERARELYAEGQRWMDLRRTKQLVRYNVEFNPYISSAKAMMDVNGTAYKLYRPIPANEIEMNTAMDKSSQNPGY